MAYEASVRALGRRGPGPGDPHQRHPGGALRPEEAVGHAGARARHPRGAPAGHRRRPGRAAGRVRDRRGALGRRRAAGPGRGERPPRQLRGARLRHPLGRRGGGVPRGRRAASRALGPRPGAGREVYDVWRLGTEPEARYRLEVLFDAYGASTKEALAALERITERADLRLRRGRGQPAPPADPARAGQGRRVGRAAGGDQLRRRDRQPGSGVGRAWRSPWASTPPRPGDHVLALAYGAGEAIAQDIEVTAEVPATATAAQVPGEAISVSTYYRWTRGRQAEPH